MVRAQKINTVESTMNANKNVIVKGNKTAGAQKRAELEAQKEAEKVAAEKAASEKVAAEKVAAEKVAAEKAASEKVAAEKVAAEKVAAEKAASEKNALVEMTKKPSYRDFFGNEVIGQIQSGSLTQGITRMLANEKSYPVFIIEQVIKTCNDGVIRERAKLVKIDWYSGKKFSQKNYELKIVGNTDIPADRQKSIKSIFSKDGKHAIAFSGSIRFIDDEKGLLEVLKSMNASQEIITLAEKLVSTDGETRYNAYDALKNKIDLETSGTCTELLKSAVLHEFTYRTKSTQGKINAFTSLKNLCQAELARRDSQAERARANEKANKDICTGYKYLIEASESVN